MLYFVFNEKYDEELVDENDFIRFSAYITPCKWSFSYLIRGSLSNGLSFTAYTYAGELPSCAFGFNTHGMVKFLRLLYIHMWLEPGIVIASDPPPEK